MQKSRYVCGQKKILIQKEYEENSDTGFVLICSCDE